MFGKCICEVGYNGNIKEVKEQLKAACGIISDMLFTTIQKVNMIATLMQKFSTMTCTFNLLRGRVHYQLVVPPQIASSAPRLQTIAARVADEKAPSFELLNLRVTPYRAAYNELRTRASCHKDLGIHELHVSAIHARNTRWMFISYPKAWRPTPPRLTFASPVKAIAKS